MRPPSVTLPIFLSKPYLDEEDISAVVEVLKSGNLVQGRKVLELESQIKDRFGVSQCSAVSNGTASLQLALLALGVGKGDEVIVPAFSYIATANVVELVGAIPVFVDIDLSTFNIDVAEIEKKITKKTKCIMPVHEFGLCADMDPILGLAKKYNISVIEDAACAVGAKYKGSYAGTFGEFASFSLHPRKSITCGEGGLLVSNSSELDRKIKTLRNHGIEPNSIPMKFVEAGFNYRLTDFQAAMVSSQIRRLEKILLRKAELVKIYYDLLSNDFITLPFVPGGSEHSWQTFHVILDNHANRNALQEYLKNNQVFVNYGAQCIPEMDFYKNKYQFDSQKDFSNAYKAYSCGLALPLCEITTDEEIIFVCELINKFKLC
jgi:dTDP-4-amino-4,6-dideoxygalactose transaminase